MKFFRAFAFVMGLVLAASDGDYFPWVNGLGVIIFIGILFVPLKKKPEVLPYG